MNPQTQARLSAQIVTATERVNHAVERWQRVSVAKAATAEQKALAVRELANAADALDELFQMRALLKDARAQS